jgi:hypothetical protein
MRNISFRLTTRQIKEHTKTVTRRLGWKNLKPGTLLQAVEKCQGLKKGEKIKKLAVIRVLDVSSELLCQITFEPGAPAKEGFPKLTASGFIAMFCREMKCTPDTEVTRIEFEYIKRIRS